MEEGRYGSELYVLSYRSRPEHPSSVSLTRASTTFYGIAATGSYVRFNSLRDAPPGGEAFNLPLRGRGTAAAVEEGRYGSELYVLSYRSRPEHPSSVSLTRASTTFYGIAATGSYVRFNSLRDAPPGGKAFLNHNFTRKTRFFHVFLLIFPGLTAGKNGGTICA